MDEKKSGEIKEAGAASSNSKADELIKEALRNLEEQVHEDDMVEVPKSDTDAQRVARIDLQQYVEKEAYMRLAADFDNFRKRALKERQEWERQGQEKILSGFLDILDNLSRGVNQAKSESGALIDGMRMVLSQCESWLSTLGLERIEGVGQVFDPSVHDAIAQVQEASKKDGEIIEEIKRGYRWANSERLLRPASVVVVKSANANSDAEQAAD